METPRLEHPRFRAGPHGRYTNCLYFKPETVLADGLCILRRIDLTDGKGRELQGPHEIAGNWDDLREDLAGFVRNLFGIPEVWGLQVTGNLLVINPGRQPACALLGAVSRLVGDVWGITALETDAPYALESEVLEDMPEEWPEYIG